MCNKSVSEGPFMLKYCLDRHKTQEMGDESVDAGLSPLQFASDSFVTDKMLK